MAIELITGRTGSAHVNSEDVGAFQAYTYGDAVYILNGCECTVSGNTVRIAAGDLLVNGRHVRITGSESVNITNGTQGRYRNDLVALEYSRDGSNVESVRLVAVTGSSSTSAAAPVPNLSGNILAGNTTAQCALYRIPLNGTTIGTPVRVASYGKPLFERMNDAEASLADLDERVSAIEGVVELWKGDAWMVESTQFDVNIPEGTRELQFLWSFYSAASGETQNVGWITTPVSMKQWAWGSGHNFILAHGADKIAFKYLYIHSNYIKGHADNEKAGTSAAGITYDNKAFSLRGVYALL